MEGLEGGAMGQWDDVTMGRWGDGTVGRWDGGTVGRWGDGAVRRREGETARKAIDNYQRSILSATCDFTNEVSMVNK